MLDNHAVPIEKRLSRRAKMSKMIRVRPSDSDDEHFEELPATVNVSEHGLYFHTNRTDYHVGMRLFITYPFTFTNDPMKSEYLAEVMRVEHLQGKRCGIAVRLLMTI
jgi:PilZ domain